MVGEILSNIKRIRKEKKISQEKVAEGLKLDYSTYGKMERGCISLYADRLEEIVKILEVDPSDIYPDLESFEFKKSLSNIRRIRKLKKISAKEIAEYLEIDPSTYRKIEKGEIRLSIERLEKIARILELKIHQLF